MNEHSKIPKENNEMDIVPDYCAPEDFQEDEDDFSISDRSNQPILYNTDWTAGTAVNQLVRGIIDLNPRFQRRSAWNNGDKSKFIESLAIGIPIPQIILAEHPRKAGKYIVIDGKQRLLSLLQFIADEEKIPAGFKKFKISGLKERKDLNGLGFEDIHNNTDGLNIENAVIRTVVIRAVKNENFLYEVFLRLNTQSKTLSPQELRQALAPGSFTDFVDDTATGSVAIKQALNIKEPDRRMRDNELVLRYFSFKTRIQEYGGNFKVFLDKTTAFYNKNWSQWQQYLEEQKGELEHAIKATFLIFGKSAFQVYEGTSYTGRFNRAVFDIMVFYFSEPRLREAALAAGPITEKTFREYCVKNDEFRNSFSVNTKETSNLYLRLSTWGDGLSQSLGINVDQLSMIGGKIVIE